MIGACLGVSEGVLVLFRVLVWVLGRFGFWVGLSFG